VYEIIHRCAMTTTTNRPRIELDANQVCALCGKSERRILAVAKYLGIAPHQFSTWYTESSAIARELNSATANPAETLQHILSQLA
jgi:hypothetical protein